VQLAAAPDSLTRASATWTASGGRFAQQPKECAFDAPSYGSIYNIRYKELRRRIKKVAADKWAGGYMEGLPLTEHISGVAKDIDTVIIGTLYREMRLKPDVLDEYKQERTVSVRTARTA
jgi:hypothetical protein